MYTLLLLLLLRLIQDRHHPREHHRRAYIGNIRKYIKSGKSDHGAYACLYKRSSNTLYSNQHPSPQS